MWKPILILLLIPAGVAVVVGLIAHEAVRSAGNTAAEWNAIAAPLASAAGSGALASAFASLWISNKQIRANQELESLRQQSLKSLQDEKLAAEKSLDDTRRSHVTALQDARVAADTALDEKRRDHLTALEEKRLQSSADLEERRQQGLASLEERKLQAAQSLEVLKQAFGPQRDAYIHLYLALVRYYRALWDLERGIWDPTKGNDAQSGMMDVEHETIYLPDEDANNWLNFWQTALEARSAADKVVPTATVVDSRSAYRKIWKKYHPELYQRRNKFQVAARPIISSTPAIRLTAPASPPTSTTSP